MATSSSLSYAQRSQRHPNALVRRLFDIAEKKKTNITVSADLETTEELLKIADALGPYIAVLKTHIDIIDDFSAQTIKGLTALSEKHNFLLFEDRKFTDIGSTVQKQYRGGPLRIRDWAHIINVTMLPGEGIVEAIEQTIKSAGTPSRGILILAEMTSKGSHAVDKYTADSVRVARKYPDSVIGFVATRELSSFASGPASTDEDLVVFTTGVNISSKGDSLGQQYQTPTTAMEGGSDFLIAGRGIYAASDPVAAVQEYRKAGWDAYLARIGKE